MVVALGIDGGSSDESDCEPNSKKVIVRKRNWRNRRVDAIYRKLDEFFPNRTGLGRPLPGNPGHPREHREDPQYVSQDREIRGLSEAYYEPIFVNSLSPLQLKGLNVQLPKPLPIPTSSPYV